MRLDPTDPLADAPVSGRSVQPDRSVIDEVCARLGISAADLRVAAWSFGGKARPDELSAFLAGTRALPDSEYNALAAALNDRLIQAGDAPAVPYSDD